MTNKRGLQRQTATAFPGAGTKLAAPGWLSRGPTTRWDLPFFCSGQVPFLDGRLWFPRALAQAPHLFPEALTQASPNKIPNPDWKEVLVLLQRSKCSEASLATPAGSLPCPLPAPGASRALSCSLCVGFCFGFFGRKNQQKRHNHQRSASVRHRERKHFQLLSPEWPVFHGKLQKPLSRPFSNATLCTRGSIGLK